MYEYRHLTPLVVTALAVIQETEYRRLTPLVVTALAVIKETLCTNIVA